MNLRSYLVLIIQKFLLAIIFSISFSDRILCIVTELVKNTWLKVTVLKVADTNKVKNDAPNVKSSLVGKGCGALAVVVY